MSGFVDIGFALPNVALWDITVSTTWRGVVASQDSTTAAFGGPLGILGSGAASGINFSNAAAGSVTGANSRRSGASAIGDVTGRLPATGSVRATINLSAESNGSEAYAGLGLASPLSSFTLDDIHLRADDGAYITVSLFPHLDFTGQTLAADIVLEPNEHIGGFGTIAGRVETGLHNNVTPTGSGLIFGTSPFDNTRMWLRGNQDIGASKLTLRAAQPMLSGLTTLAGGSLIADSLGGLLLVGGQVRGHGTLFGAVSGNGAIVAEGGNLSLGVSGRADAVSLAALLDTGTNAITLLDLDQAVLSGQAILRGGSLHAPRGVLLDGALLRGFGTVSADLVNEGQVAADPGRTLLFTGALSGGGAFTGHVAAAGRLAPGASPGLMSFQQLSLLPEATLAIELGGLARGLQYDALDVTGTASLGGSTLEVALIDGFFLDYDQAFEILDAGSLLGSFAGLDEGALVGNYGGFDLFVSYAGGDGNDVFLYTAAIPEPQTYALLLAGLALLGFTARAAKPSNPSPASSSA